MLKENDTDSSKPAKHKSSQLHEGIPLRARCSSSIFEDHQDDDGTSTIITTLEDIMSNDVEREKENSATDQNNEVGSQLQRNSIHNVLSLYLIVYHSKLSPFDV